jgi:hypothetical protein
MKILRQIDVEVVYWPRKSLDAFADQGEKGVVTDDFQRLTGTQYAKAACDGIVVMLHISVMGALDLIWSMLFGGARKVGW